MIEGSPVALDTSGAKVSRRWWSEMLHRGRQNAFQQKCACTLRTDAMSRKRGAEPISRRWEPLSSLRSAADTGDMLWQNAGFAAARVVNDDTTL